MLLSISRTVRADDPRGTAPRTASSPNEVAQPDERPADDDARLQRATPDPNPPVPRILQRRPREQPADVVEQAGVGGPVAYGSASVLEVGGSGSIFSARSRSLLRLSPYVGWFIFDGIRLSLQHDLYAAIRAGTRRFSTAMVAALSVHTPINHRLLFAASAGAGPLYNGAQWGLLLRPGLGLNVLVGRSAIFHPGAFMSWSTRDLIDPAGRRVTEDRLSFGLDISYAAMF